MNKNNMGFKGEIVTQNSSSYEDDRQEWNRAIQKYPIAIAYCTDEFDVKCVLKYCIKNNYPLRIRCGGHNYEGFSTDNNVIVIDVSRMKKIHINEENNTVTVSAGVLNSELYNFLGNRGYPFPGGTCPTVGVIGYTLGGGWGLSSRLFGLGCDNAVEFRMIDYKGNIKIANSKCNSDLYWALRGAGGGNFGIITSITFNLPPKLNKVTYFNIFYDQTSEYEQAEIMNVLQKLYINLDRRCNCRSSFYNSKVEGRNVYILGIFYGTVDELQTILKPLLEIDRASAYFEYTTFIKAINKIESIYPESEKFKSTGKFSCRLYSKEELLKLASLIKEPAEGSVYTAVTFYGLGGAVKDKKSCDTAFYYRDSNFIIGLQSVWEDSKYAEINKKWLATKLLYLDKITVGNFVNFPYYPLCKYEMMYYGNNICRLRQVSSKYDPYNIFTYKQGVK